VALHKSRSFPMFRRSALTPASANTLDSAQLIGTPLNLHSTVPIFLNFDDALT
jgi:hypothetical protein